MPHPKLKLSDTVIPSREGTYLMHWSGETLILRSSSPPARHELSTTAAMVWNHCDGRDDLGTLCAQIGEQFDANPEAVAADVRDTVGDLLQRRLIKTRVDNQPLAPTVRVGFRNFGPDFDPTDNPLAWLLATVMNVLVVNPDEEPVDVLFFSDYAAAGFALTALDRDRTVLVSVPENDPPDYAQCDFALVRRPVDGGDPERTIILPADPLTPGRTPTTRLQEAAARLYELLFDELPPNAPSTMAQQPVRKKLTIGMATFDDFDGVYFTVQAIRLYHPEVADDIEILVIDNNPGGPCAESLQNLGNWIKNYRYIPNREIQGTAARDFVFREAWGTYVLCVDSHVMLAPGSLMRLLAYFDQHPDCSDLLQGPMVYDDLRAVSTHFEPVWRDGMYGTWGTDPRGLDPDAEPFEIPMQGLGLFACRRDAWLGFNPRFQGFGGEEGYIHEKFRQAGNRTLCLPFLRWMHRFGRPLGTRYKNVWEDRVRNYLIGFEELGLDTTPVEDHFLEKLGPQVLETAWRNMGRNPTNPFDFFNAIYCINLDRATDRWEAMCRRFAALGIESRVQRFSAIETPTSHHIGCALSNRTIIADALARNLNNVLVLEDDAEFLDGTLIHLRRSLAELPGHDWNLLHFGGHRWGNRFQKAPGCRYLEMPTALTSAHAIAFNKTIFEKILADLPADQPGMIRWLKIFRGFDQYLNKQEGRLLTVPAVATQAPLKPVEDAALRHRYTI